MKKFIKPKSFSKFMMVLSLSSVAIAKFYMLRKTNENYKFYRLVILFFIDCCLLFIFQSFKLINLTISIISLYLFFFI
ncbi:hypothetical protein HMPREF0220_1555 [Clostridioides difficile NAP08]|uniref:Uncharacterized protein n=1 Tax=Clostridioides difficile NAP08 TaxID=525259 RepID=D5Q3S3_CLODI|nr:hypothetical protein HMPREF0220_1555 [Clostridioides difficile NAP08]